MSVTPNVRSGTLTRRTLLAFAGLSVLPHHNGAFAGVVVDSAGFKIAASAPKRIVSIGSASTEILVELGFAEQIVAIDTTSQGVIADGHAPDIGYMRALAAEGILAQTPDLIVATMDSGPKEVIETLRAAGVPLLQLPIEPTIDSIIAKINMLGSLLDVQAKSDALAAQVRKQAVELSQTADNANSRPKTLFILSMANNRMTVGGKGTAANAVLELAGATNIASDIEGYKPFSPELVVANPPDVIVIMTNQGHSALATNVLENEALAATPAAKNKAFYPVDGAALLSFGTRTLHAASALAKLIHGGV
jgi:iron complex transport system substrate-binding protein